jgi:hypothetical protein
MGLSMAEAEGLTRAMDGAACPGGILCWSILRHPVMWRDIVDRCLGTW